MTVVGNYMWIVAVLVIAGFVLAHTAVADEEESSGFNPSDPTVAASHIEVIPEYNKGTDYESPLLRLIYDIDWGHQGKYSITAEIPYGYIDFEDDDSATGLGDIRLRYFHRLFSNPDPDARVQNVVASLDTFLPTGSSSKGLGLGTTLLAPTVIFDVPLTERITAYPMPKLKFSTSKTLGRSSAFSPGKDPTPARESEEYIYAFGIESYFIYQDPSGFWVFLDPVIEWDLLPERGEDNYEMTLKGQIGKMFGRWGLGAESTVFVAGEKSQEFQDRLMYYYYF